MADIETGLNDWEAQYASIIREHTAQRIGRIRAAASQGLDTEELFTTIGAVVSPGRAVKEQLLRTLKGVRDFGRQQVRAELKRQ